MSLFMFSYLRPILYNSNIILPILHALFLVVKITDPLETNIPKCRGPGGGGGGAQKCYFYSETKAVYSVFQEISRFCTTLNQS